MDERESLAFEESLAGLPQKELDTRLWRCAERNELKKAEILLARGASGKSKSGAESTTPLTQACLNGHVEMARLLAPRSRLNHTDDEGSTAVLRCCQESQAMCLELLIELGADVNKPNDRGMTPLIEALGAGGGYWEQRASMPSTGRPLNKASASPAERAAACLDLLLPVCDLAQKTGDNITAIELARIGKMSQLAAKISDIQGGKAALAEKGVLERTHGVEPAREPKRPAQSL